MVCDFRSTWKECSFKNFTSAKTKSEQKLKFSRNISHQKVSIKSSNRLQTINKIIKHNSSFQEKEDLVVKKGVDIITGCFVINSLIIKIDAESIWWWIRAYFLQANNFFFLNHLWISEWKQLFWWMKNNYTTRNWFLIFV